MASLRVLTLTTDDWPVWRDARVAALTEAPHAFKSRLADWNRGGEAQWRTRMETPGAFNIVAMLEDRVVGMARGVPGRDGVRVSEIRSVWISPEARGRGVGDRLLTAMEGWALRAGATAVKLAVFPDNAPALALYARNGFVASQELGDLLPDGVTRERVMVKPLR